jgi:hypothetical protein
MKLTLSHAEMCVKAFSHRAKYGIKYKLHLILYTFSWVFSGILLTGITAEER